MSREGLPAILSADGVADIPYWERELKECPRLVDRLETDVNNAVEVLDKIRQGVAVDYSAIRGEKVFEAGTPAMYSICRELSTYPNADTKEAVVIKDAASKCAAVILPAGASLEVDNEVPGMSKNRFVDALHKEGFDNVKFYNAGGSLALNQPNDFFAGKTVEVARLNQCSLVVSETVDVSAEISHSHEVDFNQLLLTYDDSGSPLLFVQPFDEKPFFVYPETADVEELKDAYSQFDFDTFDTVRERIARKYYGIVQRHPDLKFDGMPEVDTKIDPDRFSEIRIVREPDKSMYVCAIVDGTQQDKVRINSFTANRFWLVEDKDMYKLALANNAYPDKSIINGQTEGGLVQFPAGGEGQGSGNRQEAGEAQGPTEVQQGPEEEPKRGGGIRL